MPPGMTTNASDTIMKWCSREKKVRCSKAWVTNGFTSCSNGQLDVDADGAAQARGIDGVRAFVRRLHQAGAAAGEDVAAHRGEFGGELFHAFVRRRAGLEARGTEDGHAVVLPRGAAQAGEIVDDFPQSADGALEERDGGVLVAEFDDVGLSEGWMVVLMLWLGRVSARSTASERACSGKTLMCSKRARLRVGRGGVEHARPAHIAPARAEAELDRLVVRVEKDRERVAGDALAVARPSR